MYIYSHIAIAHTIMPAHSTIFSNHTHGLLFISVFVLLQHSLYKQGGQQNTSNTLPSTIRGIYAHKQSLISGIASSSSSSSSSNNQAVRSVLNSYRQYGTNEDISSAFVYGSVRELFGKIINSIWKLNYQQNSITSRPTSAPVRTIDFQSTSNTAPDKHPTATEYTIELNSSMPSIHPSIHRNNQGSQ